MHAQAPSASVQCGCDKDTRTITTPGVSDDSAKSCTSEATVLCVKENWEYAWCGGCYRLYYNMDNCPIL